MTEPFTAGRVLREVVPPLVTLFVVVCAMLVAVRRAGPTAPARPPGSEMSSAPFYRSLAVTVFAGYVFFLAIVLVFMTLATGDASAFPSAVTGGAALLAIAVPVWLVLSWVERRLRG